jgi:hypothetical protein
MAEQKVIGILIAVGLCLVAGIFAVMDQDKGAPDKSVSATVPVAPAAPEEAITTGALPPPNGQTEDQVSQAPWSGKILVSKGPVQVLAAPTSSASAMYGFPAGRPFRAIGREAGFVRIQDIQSGASGWIDEAALAPAPERPAAAAPRSDPAATGTGRPVTSAKAKPQSKKATVETLAPADAKPEPIQQKRRGLFGGGGGLFGGLFGGRQ